MDAMISEDELQLCRSVRKLRYGILRPREFCATKHTRLGGMRAPEWAMIKAIRAYGTPLKIEVSDGQPTYGIFRVETEVGWGEKRIKFNL